MPETKPRPATPWALSHENSGGGQNIVDAHGRCVAITFEFIDHGKRHGGDILTAEALANAELIVQAPEMRSTLEDVANRALWALNNWPDWDGETYIERYMPTLLQIRDVISGVRAMAATVAVLAGSEGFAEDAVTSTATA